MPRSRCVRITMAAVVVVVIAMFVGSVYAQSEPYRLDQSWSLKLPEGRKLGGVIGVEFDRKGNLWIFERCGATVPGSCGDSKLSPIMEFDPSGKLLKSFGEGLFVSPHGFHVDKDGNIWASDNGVKEGKGHQVIKFSPEGKVLATLGKAGATADGENSFNAPTDMVVARNGDVFVADGHGGKTNQRIVKFSKDGKFIKAWGKKGSAPGEFDTIHALALDSKGRLFVGDRENNRIQIFDQDGKFLDEWKQFGRPSGIFIDAKDAIYVTDDETDAKNNPGGKKGIRIGSAKDGTVTAFIPPLGPADKPESVTEGITADKMGNVYGAETTTTNVRRYVKN